ncbi:MAG TPA: hypothetical protein VJY33_15225, partial [Isosphaeraceae bacterium]|nr:hypothetical protein [Isosphaeraceae bacterium]
GASRQQYTHTRTRGAGQFVEGIFPSSGRALSAGNRLTSCLRAEGPGGYGSRPPPLANTYGAHSACSCVVSRPFHDYSPRAF